MKLKSLIPAMAVAAITLFLAACTPAPTANDKQRDQQARITSEAASEVGMPNITHFREMRLLKAIYEMRDQDNLATWTYVFNQMTAKFAPFCVSIGYPIPYAAQYSAPESMQTYNVINSGNGDHYYYGAARLPQAEPNGLNMPAAAEGTWVMCIGPDKKAHPVYAEPRVTAFPYQLPDSMLQH